MLDRVLTAGRAAAEALMVDQVRLYEQAPDVFDRDTGSNVPGAQTPFYTGKARVRQVTQSAGNQVEAGEREVLLRQYEVTLPWGATLPAGVRIAPGHLVEVQASPDARLQGLTLHVTGVQYGATTTAWRLTVEDRS